MEVLDTKDVIGVQSEPDRIQTHYAGYRLPSLLARVKALVVDMLIVLAIFTLTTLVINVLGEVPDMARGLILVFMFYLYDPLLTSLTGATLGHRFMNLTVRKYAHPERRISFGQAFVRFLTKGLLGWLSFLTVTGNSCKRAIHDLVSGTIVLVDK